MAQKLLVNTTRFDIEGTITGRAGNTPGQVLNAVPFTLSPNLQQFVPFGDAANPHMDALLLSVVGENISILIELSKDKASDNLFNTNDTLFISIENESFVVSAGNTWTVYR